MKNVRILDCTLRDGGRVIDCAFPDSEIKAISNRLADAKIDIVEVGFLRDGRKREYKGGTTFFTDVDQMKPFVDKSKKNVIYTAFVDYGMVDLDNLKPYDGTSIDAIRFGFTKKHYMQDKEDVKRCIYAIKEKGYKVFVQGVNSLNYSDREMLEIVDMINEVHPYSFGIVDTYGAMYMDDVDRLYGLIDNNMHRDICINFHSHNNYQLSFAFAQEIIKLSRGTRQVIIDATLSGMGKVSGNLNTELLVEYMVRKLHYDYEVDDILDIIDDYIYKYSLKHRWGYSTAAMMAGVYMSHQNNVIYLTEKFRLDTKDIGKIMSMLPPDKRQRYDYDEIERVYIEYIANKVDDRAAISMLKEVIGNREVLVLVPGNSLKTHADGISQYIEQKKPFVISVNFVSGDPEAYAFFGNQKRFNMLEEACDKSRIVRSSNVKAEGDSICVNYHSLINRGYKYFENSAIMLLNLLKRMEISRITIAGFDGFEAKKTSNYADASFQNDRHVEGFANLNAEIGNMLVEIVKATKDKCDIRFLTPSRFESVLK